MVENVFLFQHILIELGISERVLWSLCKKFVDDTKLAVSLHTPRRAVGQDQNAQ